MGKSIVTPVGRCSFPSLEKVNAYGKYSMTVLFLKTDAKVQEFVKWLSTAVKEEALTHGDANYAAAMRDFVSFKNGDDAKAFKTYRNEYAGHWVVSMNRQADFGKPCVVGRNRQPIDPADVYAGCDVLVYIDVYAYKFGAKKSVAIGFQHVMKVAENTRFSATGVAVDNAFANLDLPEETADALGDSPFGAAVPQQPVAPPVAAVPTVVRPAPPKVPVAAPAAAYDPFAAV